MTQTAHTTGTDPSHHQPFAGNPYDRRHGIRVPLPWRNASTSVSSFTLITKNAVRISLQRVSRQKPKLLLQLLALLVSHAARGLAGGLAGSLALAAATFFRGLGKVSGIQSFDSFHYKPLSCTARGRAKITYRSLPVLVPDVKLFLDLRGMADTAAGGAVSPAGRDAIPLVPDKAVY